jgi:SNF2 family DNA or RNA helicase
MKLTPFKHQAECLKLSWEKKNFAILLEQGLGKTKVCLDTAELLFKAHRIEAMLVVAPNGVHSNWAREQIPLHLDCPYVMVEYSAGRYQTNDFQNQLYVLTYPTIGQRKLRVLIVNVEAYSNEGRPILFKNKYIDPIQKVSKKFLEKFSTLMVIDESTRIKTPRAQRTKRILGLGRHAKYRRILTGTPVTQSPFDIYSQFAFLDYGILGFFSYTSFKHNYGRWEKKFTQRGDKSWEYDELIEYIHLDDLRQRLKPHYYRREKIECLDLPPKIYKVMGVDLSPQQRRLYQQVEKEGVLEFDDFRLLTPLQITRLLRCQQITGGFLPTGEQGVARPLKDNPKLDLMLELIEDHPGQTIIWARFRAEITAIVSKLKETYGGDSVVEYHGGVPANKRPGMIKIFQASKARFLVGQQASGVGIDLYAAETVFYFSNDFSYDHRYQSEDRCHRIGLLHPVLYIDLIANDTMDERIRWVHERARKAAVAVLGEKKK